MTTTDAAPEHRPADPLQALLLEGLFEHSVDGVVLVRTDGTVLRANPSACRAFGMTETEICALGRGGIVVAGEALDRFLAVRARDGVTRGELEYRRGDGTTFPAEVTSGLIDSGGAPTAYVIFRDLTEQRRAEALAQHRLADLHERERWLQASQEVARIGHYVFDIPRDRWTGSEVLDQIFGIDAAYQRSAAGWLALIHLDDREDMTAYLGELLASGARFDREYRLVARPGQPDRWVHGLGELRRDAAGHPLQLFGTIQDVTARHEAERAREELAGQLRQAQRLESIGRLAGGVAHDFNNLLTVILSCSDVLREDLASGRKPEQADVEEIHAAGLRARDLTRQLLAFARKQVIAPEPLDLDEVVRRSQKLLARVLGEDIELRVELQSGGWLALCDGGQVEQALLNLAVNARDAMPMGGTLVVRTGNGTVEPGSPEAAAGRIPGEWVRLLVSDSGAGLSPEARAHLFEPFFTTKAPGLGTGLGLATVHGIVNQSGGHVHAESAPGRGTTFELCFPRTTLPSRPPAREATSTPRRGWETVLVVEDDAQVREVMARALAGNGYRVLTASAGAEALRLALAGPAPVHLVVSDVVMPGMDGPTLARELRRHRPGLKVLFASGYSQDAIEHHGVLLPGVELIAKPFTAPVLLERVRRVLDAG